MTLSRRAGYRRRTCRTTLSQVNQLIGTLGAARTRPPGTAPGLALAAAIAVAAVVTGRFVPLVGAPVVAVVLGVSIAAWIRPGPRFVPGIAVGGTRVLQLSVVVLGSQLSLGQIARVGAGSAPVMVGTLAAALVAAYWIGRWLRVPGDLRTLIGVGTGVCGASAIAAVTPVIGAAGAEVAYAVSTIFLFNVSAVVVFPIVGHLLGLSQHAFGLFAGTAVNDMSSVVATATSFGHEAASYAIVVKLARTLLIIPICLGLSALAARRAGGVRAIRVRSLVPRFLLWFLLVAALNSVGLVPAAWHSNLSVLSGFLITVALAALGLSVDLAGLRRAGARPLVLGGLLWLVVSLVSLGLQRATGTL